MAFTAKKLKMSLALRRQDQLNIKYGTKAGYLNYMKKFKAQKEK